MKIVLFHIIILLYSCVHPPVEAEVKSVEDPLSHWVLHKKIQDSESKWIGREGEYFLDSGKCRLKWRVAEKREKGHLQLAMQGWSQQEACIVEDYIELHRKILGSIFKEWDKRKVQGITMGSLDVAADSMKSAKGLAVLSAQSDDYQDYRKNYPKHKSQKHVNQILIEIVNQGNIDKELKSLFAGFGLQINLGSCEKVFTEKAKELPFADQLPPELLAKNHRLMYGAGIYYYNVKSF